MSDPAQLLAEFRQAVDQHLHDIHGLRASDADTQKPTNDDRHLIAFARAASVIHPSLDPCAQLRADVKAAQTTYDYYVGQVNSYGQEDFDPTTPSKSQGQQYKEPPPDELVQAKNNAGLALSKKKKELAACEQAKTVQQGQICYELHQVGEKLSYWLCVPHPTASTYLWYEFARQQDGSFVSVANPHLYSTPYPFWPDRPIITKTGDWAGHASYGPEQNVFPGTDPPHWSPVLVMGTHKAQVHMPGDAKGGHSPANVKTVDAPDEPDPAVAKKLHDLMSSQATIAKGVAMINKARPLGQVLTRRVATHFWPPITLRGRVTDSGLSGEDFSGDHATAYLEDGGPATGWQASDSIDWVPFGPVGLVVGVSVLINALAEGEALNVTNKNWPGMDWDMHVETDPDVAYLSSVCRPHELQVEIEQFALKPASYRPHVNDWLQATGRWVFDCGHSDGDEHYTEIHPPELIVATHMVGESTHTSAITTGAWLGSPLRFVVFPPPRPSVTSKLQVSTNVDIRENAGFTYKPVPEDNPNHVFVMITALGQPAIQLVNTGMVVMSNARRLAARIQCSWTEQTATVTVSPGGVGTHVYFRDPDVTPPFWTPLPAAGASLRPIQYVFRGAGSGWDFEPQPITLEPGVNHLTLKPRKETYPASLPVPPDFSPHKRTASSDFDERENLREAAWATLSGALLKWKLPNPPFSAQPKLNASYAEKGIFFVHLFSFVDFEGKPVTDLDAELVMPHKSTTGAEWYPPDFDPANMTGKIATFLKGKLGPGVGHAKVQATLTLGNDAVGRHYVSQTQAITTASGAAAFAVHAGSHPEDAAIRLDVVDNPANPWFKPTVLSPSVFFLPGSGSDLEPNPAPYMISVPTAQELAAAGVNLNALSKAITTKVLLKPGSGIAVVR